MKILLVLCSVAVFSWGAWQRSGETVIDTETKLQWQDGLQNEERDTVWRDARGYCANLDAGGFHDWRLPTRKELSGLVMAVHSGAVKFNHAELSAYWTSEINKKNPINAWAVYWGNGHIFDNDRCDEAHVRCVRDR